MDVNTLHIHRYKIEKEIRLYEDNTDRIGGDHRIYFGPEGILLTHIYKKILPHGRVSRRFFARTHFQRIKIEKKDNTATAEEILLPDLSTGFLPYDERTTPKALWDRCFYLDWIVGIVAAPSKFVEGTTSLLPLFYHLGVDNQLYVLDRSGLHSVLHWEPFTLSSKSDRFSL